MTLLIDSNVLVAAADRRDAHNGRARALLSAVTAERPFTTDHVVVESWAVIRRRAGYEAAERFLDGLRRSPLALESVTLADLERARWIGERWADQEFDLVDRTAMAVMERLGCSRVATFDRDFAVYRYGPGRRTAFEVLS
ncbi:MAG: PIN domain-containing protein [Acidobacteria bacterium]|nr:PIN domain-containing protein [Acidobacteriota bacterium]